MVARAEKRDYFAEGIALFNDGRYFECHEAWEEIWKRSHGEEKVFLQGLIQAAVAILHAERGNKIGAGSLCSKAFEKLDRFPHEHQGIGLGDLRDELRRFFATALDDACKDLPPRPKVRRI